MQMHVLEKMPPNLVVAVFDDRAVLFDLPPVATLADLSERLAQIVERHGDALRRVDVRICPLAGMARPNHAVAARADRAE